MTVLSNPPAQESMVRRAIPRAGSAPPTSPRDEITIRRLPAAATERDSRSPARSFLDALFASDRVPSTSGLRSANTRQRIALYGRQEARTPHGRAGHHFDKEPPGFLCKWAQAGPTLASIAGHLFGAARVRAADGLIMGHDARCKQPARRRARDVQPPCWHHRDNLLLRQALCAR